MLKSGRKIVVNGATYQWKIQKSVTSWRSPKWALRMVVESPSGARLTVALFSKVQRYPEERHQAVFSPLDVRLRIEEAIEAGWDPRSKSPFILIPKDIPERDFGPEDAPARTFQERPSPKLSYSKAECMVCFKKAGCSTNAVLDGFDRVFPAGWQVVAYGSEEPGAMENGIVCSEKCLDEYLVLVRQQLPSVYERILRNAALVL